jgi:hypothetical protein
MRHFFFLAMKIDLAVIGRGAVTPAGVGLPALFKHTPAKMLTSSAGRTDRQLPVFRVNLQDTAFSRWQREPRLRRASPISFFLVEAAEQALRGLEKQERKRTGLIIAFCAGCLAYSRRFFQAIVEQGQKTASPALFPETVFNSPLSHVAATLGLEGSAYALVGDEVAWITALKTAFTWLQQNRLDQVLVLGVEEFDPIVLDAYLCAGWMKRTATGFVPGEGAAGILVKRSEAKDPLVISSAWDGFIYRSSQDAARAADRCFREIDTTLPYYQTAQHNWFASIERKLSKDRPVFPKENQPYLGEAFTASAAWHTLRALTKLEERPQNLVLPIWGLNHQVGALELQSRY